MSTWQTTRHRAADAARTAGGTAGRVVVGGLARVLGPARMAAWSVAVADDREAALGRVTEELTPLDDVTPADLAGAYLRGYVLMGRGGEARPQLILRYVRPRAVIDAASARVPSRVRTYLRRGDLEIGDSMPLEPVIRACAERERTWIVEPVVQAWLAADAAGLVTTWTASRDGVPVAGMWGIDLGRTYGIASMFHTEDGAGAVAMAALLGQLGTRWDLVDCGSLKPHFARFGAYEVTPQEFRARVLAGVVGPSRTAPETAQDDVVPAQAVAR
ncbi:hypothetical protein [Isoptericola sp. NPDC057191]|uniref:hypothetical protein n=1 Tax=Isoptericola sp. NPDC057191 TaxID=3346041 RepID=UPI00362E4316